MSERRLTARSERIRSNRLFARRNPGVGFGAEGWGLDEFPHPLCPGKRKQVQRGGFSLEFKGKWRTCSSHLHICGTNEKPDGLGPTLNVSPSVPQLRGSQDSPGSDQAAGAGVFHPGREPNRPGLHHHQVQAAQHRCLGVSAAAF